MPAFLKKPLWLWIYRGAFIALLFSCAALIRALDVVVINCSRPEPSSSVRCEKQRKTFLGLVREPAQIFESVLMPIHKMEVEGGYRKNSDGTREYYIREKHRIVLKTSGGEQLFMRGRLKWGFGQGNVTEMAAIATQMNDFILSQELQFSLKVDNRLKVGGLLHLGVYLTIYGFVLLLSELWSEWTTE